MANEITAVVSLSASKSGASINTVGSSGSATKQYDMTGADMASGTANIGTSDEALPIPADIATCKALFIKNLDATNYVEFSYGTGGSFAAVVRIDPGMSVLFRPTSTTCYVKANTAACDIFWAAVEV
jgi:hypothetical protein